MDRPSPQARELVFCHACENEWYRDEHGLVCPGCQSEFTEVIESDHDPRAAVPDPDEDDISFLPTARSTGSPAPEIGNIFQTFGNLLGGAMGGPPGSTPSDRSSSAQDRARSVPPNRQTAGPAPGQPRVQIYTNSGPGFSFTARTSTYMYGDGHNPNEPQDMQTADLGRMLVDLIGTIQGRTAYQPGANRQGPPGGPGAPPGLGDFMNHFLGVNGNPGDYINSQDAFDRVMSQLMEQHQAGSAPGPASEDAIGSLAQRPADRQLLGGDCADCSICMLEVTPGVPVAVLPCGHWYHPDCIAMWLREHDTCAICRKGITPKDGDRGAARRPEQEPLHNEDPASIARRQTGAQDDPIWVPESPARDRWSRPSARRHSSAGPASPDGGGGNSNDTGGGGGASAWGRTMRNLFSGSSGTGSGGGAGAGGSGGGGGGSASRSGRRQ